jgi:hypothetical protein
MFEDIAPEIEDIEPVSEGLKNEFEDINGMSEGKKKASVHLAATVVIYFTSAAKMDK